MSYSKIAKGLLLPDRSTAGTMEDKRRSAMKVKAHRGFTMVEMLTVIAIIAILAAIIFPVFATVRKNVYKGQCTANLHSLAIAIKLYKDDYRIYPEALLGYARPNQPART